MKHSRTIVILSLILGFIVESTIGQAGFPGIKVMVPFRFAIGRSAFSAGSYSIFSSRDKIWVQEPGGRNVAVLLTGALDGKASEKGGRVIFDCYSDECFLSQVWISGQGVGRTVPKSKRQIELASMDAGQQFSLLGTKPKR